MPISIHAIPYISLARRFMSGHDLLQSVAHHYEILSPQVTETLPPTIFLPGQIERITGTVSPFKVEDVIRAMLMTTVTHRPTIAFHMKNAVLLDGCIYIGGHKHFVADKSLFARVRDQAAHLASAALSSSYLGTTYFGHWLTDDCTRYALAETMAPPLCLRRPEFVHQNTYQTYFAQDWTATDRAWIDNLVILDDYAHNHHRRARYCMLRDRISKQVPTKGRCAYVYLRRGNTGVSRIAENEDEILKVLTDSGFLILDIEVDGLPHIIECLRNAEVVISIEGSHMAHCVFACPENSALLVLEPADRFSAVARRWATGAGLRTGFVVGTKRGIGYYFAPQEIFRTLDRMLAA